MDSCSVNLRGVNDYAHSTVRSGIPGTNAVIADGARRPTRRRTRHRIQRARFCIGILAAPRLRAFTLGGIGSVQSPLAIRPAFPLPGMQGIFTSKPPSESARKAHKAHGPLKRDVRLRSVFANGCSLARVLGAARCAQRFADKSVEVETRLCALPDAWHNLARAPFLVIRRGTAWHLPGTRQS